MIKIKICGLCRMEDIAAVNAALPDYIGFVFAESRRRVDIKTAAALKEGLDPRITPVGVFVNEDIHMIAELYQNNIISMAQLHGDEDGRYIDRLKKRCDCPVIKVAAVLDRLPAIPAGADYALYDTVANTRGGAGVPFDWKLLEDKGPPYFLAGGLNAGNIADAVRFLPFCVDVSSGVETQGIKDPKKIAEFVRSVRRNE